MYFIELFALEKVAERQGYCFITASKDIQLKKGTARKHS